MFPSEIIYVGVGVGAAAGADVDPPPPPPPQEVISKNDREKDIFFERLIFI